VERECGVLGRYIVDFVAVDVYWVHRRVCWDILFVWGVLQGAYTKDGVGALWEHVGADNDLRQTMAGFAYNIPVIGPYLAKGLQVAGDKAGANERAHKDLPV
jgi:hypothetical protein